MTAMAAMAEMAAMVISHDPKDLYRGRNANSHYKSKYWDGYAVYTSPYIFQGTNCQHKNTVSQLI